MGSARRLTQYAGAARCMSRSGLRDWRPTDEREHERVQPWLEAPSPYDYWPLEAPLAETQTDEDEERSSRVVIIEI
jgi:hypothetical protein